MNPSVRHPLLFSVVAAIVALLLCGIPLPHALDLLRPDWLLLVVIWFALTAPATNGLVYAWAAGLGLDAFHGLVLGENALAFVVVGYLVQHLHLRLRMVPTVQQALSVMSLLALYQFLLFWIDGVTGHAVTSWVRWLPVVTGALVWPPVSAILGHFAGRR